MLEVRHKIFDWATQYHIHLDREKLNLNRIIFSAKEDKRKLRGDITVGISSADLTKIGDDFDTPTVRKLALALLCYAKVMADRENTFDISFYQLCDWCKCSKTQFYSYYLKELTGYGFLEIIKNERNKKIWSWDKNVKNKSATVKLQVNCNNVTSGNDVHYLRDNDLEQLYNECFPK